MIDCNEIKHERMDKSFFWIYNGTECRFVWHFTILPQYGNWSDVDSLIKLYKSDRLNQMIYFLIKIDVTSPTAVSLLNNLIS